MPSFSVIIPIKPDGYASALTYLRSLDTPHPFEILVSEGKRPSRQRNEAARMARGDIIVFIDDDSRLSKNYLAICAKLSEDQDVAIVGGPSLTPSTDSPVQQLFGMALSCFFGAAGVRNRYQAVGKTRTTTEKELILCNLAIRREVFLEMGGFDERLYPNEENEFLDRAKKAGCKILHSPDLAIYRSQRESLRLFMRQMFSYGRGRGEQTRITGVVGTISGFAPLFFLFYIMALPATHLTLLSLLPLILYLVLDLCFTVITAVTKRSAFALALVFIFPLMHISNGIGLVSGLLCPRKSNDDDCSVNIKIIKGFDGTLNI